jgi:uncharacterized protein (DUF983 family)
MRRLDGLAMSLPGETGGEPPRPSTLAAILGKRCPRCRQGSVFRSRWVMNEDCPACGLDFDRGDPGYFTGAMYVSYALAIPLIALLTLIEHFVVPHWSIFRLVVLASLFCLPLVAWIWQYSRVVWIYFDQYIDPADQEGEHGSSEPEA